MTDKNKPKLRMVETTEVPRLPTLDAAMKQHWTREDLDSLTAAVQEMREQSATLHCMSIRLLALARDLRKQLPSSGND